MVKCIFCGKEPEPENGAHHIIPQVVRKIMNWHGKRAESAMLTYRVPLCKECHIKVNLLQEPLVAIIKNLRTSPPLPVTFAYMMEDICKILNEPTISTEEDK